MSEDLDPGAIRSRSFSTARRGFDRDEVEAFLEDVGALVESLQNRIATTEARLGQLGITDLPQLKEEFDAVGRDVKDILQAARDAAEDMRDRATADAAGRRAEAATDVEERLAEGQSQAEHLRRDAWNTAESLLNQSVALASSIEAKAAEDNLFVRAEAEREALRLTGDAKRDADEMLRVARTESDRIVGEARSESETTKEEAQQAADSAQERARALEQRREQLMLELETARQSISELEEQIEGRRGELTNPATRPIDSTVRVVAASDEVSSDHGKSPSGESDPGDPDPGDPATGGWLDEDLAVRVVPTPMAMDPVDADAMAAEVESLRRSTEPESMIAAEPERVSEPAQATESPPEPVAALEPLPEPEPAQEPEPVAALEPLPAPEPTAEPTQEPEQQPVPQPRPDSEGPADDRLNGLFASLREPVSDQRSEPEPQPPPSAAEPQPPPEPQSTPDPPPTPEHPPAAEPRPGAETETSVIDPRDLRERMLVPITNEVVRSIKREIVDVQNAVLEELRVGGDDWRPKKAMFATVLDEEVATVASRAYMAGAAASGELAGSPPPELADASSHDLSGLVTDLWAAVVDSIDGVTSAGNRERSAAVGRTFRAWRTDEAERRVRELAHVEYNSGVAAGLAAAGISVTVSPSGRDIADPDASVIPLV